MDPWREGGHARTRRRAVLAVALLAHGLFVAALLRSRLTHDRPREDAVVAARIWLPAAPSVVSRATPAPAPRPRPPPPTPLRSIPHPVSEPGAIQAPVAVPSPIARADAPAASAASAPLDLSLSRDQLRAIIAGSRPALGQRAPAALAALAALGGDDAPYVEKPLPGGETEVHVHGGCFRMVPTARSQYDAFNHGGEKLTAPCQ
jgi:hypothetical protein